MNPKSKFFIVTIASVIARILMTFIGTWLIAKKFITESQASMVFEGASLVMVSTTWSIVEKWFQSKKLVSSSEIEAVISSRVQEILDSKAGEVNELIHIGLKLPSSSTVEDVYDVFDKSRGKS